MEPGVKERMMMGLVGCLAIAVLVVTINTVTDGTPEPSMMGLMASFDGKVGHSAPGTTGMPMPVLPAMRVNSLETVGPRCLLDVAVLASKVGSAVVDAQHGAYAVHVAWTGGVTSSVPDQDCAGDSGFMMSTSTFYTLKAFGRAPPTRSLSQ